MSLNPTKKFMTSAPEHKIAGQIFKVTKVIRETQDAITLIFEPQNKAFYYRPGQYIALIIHGEGREAKRFYSLTSSPYTEPFPSVTIKKTIDGKSSWLFFQQVKPGMSFEIFGPSGIFIPKLDAHHEYPYVFFAGGSGITPLISMIKSILDQEPRSGCTLVYQNKNLNSIIFRDQLESLVKTNSGRFRLVHILSQPGYGWQGRCGRINRPMIADILTDIPQLHIQQGQYYICGPAGMEKTVIKSLKFIGVPETNIFTESY